jgi:hypothetical protein
MAKLWQLLCDWQLSSEPGTCNRTACFQAGDLPNLPPKSEPLFHSYEDRLEFVSRFYAAMTMLSAPAESRTVSIVEW